jgi:hypothetical protein
MLAAAPYRVDQDARALRERLELAVLSDDDHACAEAARALVQFCADHPEDVLCTMLPESLPAKPETAKRIESKYEGRCKACDARVIPGEFVLWTPGEKGVRCLRCGETKR